MSKSISQMAPLATITGEELLPVALNGSNYSIKVKDIGVGLDKSSLGLSKVDNTSDADKPISTATKAALDAKSDNAHNHAISDVTGLQAAIDAKADKVHMHSISGVTGLQTALDNKADKNHTHTASEISDINKAISDAVTASGISTDQVIVDALDW